jgi:probable phosphoglycerate mutase
VPLTATGEEQARGLSAALGGRPFQLVLSSPRRRARDTAELAGFRPDIDGDLAEWDYGDLEGLTIDQIRARYPGWTIWSGPWPGGEEPPQVVARVDRVVQRALGLADDARALVFAHGHVLRVLAARWLRLPGTEGRLFVLGTATVSELGWEHGQPAVQCWNMPAAAPAARPL